MTGDGTFRQDLFFRINGAHIHLPPLRERREDIPRIVRHAIAKFAGELLAGQPTPEISDAALMRLTGYGWPGNVRQLINVVENMVVMAIGDAPEGGAVRIDVTHIPAEVASGDHEGGSGESSAQTGSLAGTSLEQLEKQAIRETLKLTGGNREQTAKLLGIGERTLYRKLKEYGLR
jgi:two-component system response regulator HydG